MFTVLSLLLAGKVAWGQEMLVSGFYSNEVHRYDFKDGTYLGPLDKIPNPQGMSYGPDGNLYVASEGDDKILRYDPSTHQLIDEFVADDPLTPEDETGGLDNPTAVIFGPDNRLYVASFETDSIKRYDETTGAYIDDFVLPQSGGLNGPDAGMVFGPDGHLYVPSYWTHSVLRYDGLSGIFIDAFVAAGAGGLNRPRTLVFRSDGMLFVSGEGSNGIHRYDAAGDPIDKFISWLDPTGFAISPLDGNVYVTSSTHDAVRCFDGTTGEKIKTLVKSGSGGLNTAVFLAFLPDNHLKTSRIDPGQAGEMNSLEITQATPNAPVFLLTGTVPASIKLGGYPHAYLGIKDPNIFTAVADGSGTLSLSARVHAALSGQTVLLQAVDPNDLRVSNLVVQVFF